MFKKYHPSLDHVLAGLEFLRTGRPVKSAKSFMRAMSLKEDLNEVIATLDSINVIRPNKPAAKVTLSHAMSVLAAKAKSKKNGKKKKKTKADLDSDSLDEDDLLNDSEDETEMSADEDMTDDSLEVDDITIDDDDEGETEMSADEGDTEDLDLDVLDDDDDVDEMPEAQASTGLGTQEEVKPGDEGSPDATDLGEPPTDVTKTPVAAAKEKAGMSKEDRIKEKKKAQAAAARSLLTNIQLLERQSAEAAARTSKKMVKK